MTGYGVRSDTRACTKETVRLSTDSGAARPSLVAHAVDADYQINAISGRGLVRNYAGVEPDRTMSALYPRTLPGRTAVWQDPSWRPRVILVLLFNDVSTPLHPGERWPDLTALAGDYVQAYGQLIANLHQRAPAATLVLPWPDFAKSKDPSLQQLSAAAQAAIRAAAAKAGVPRIEFPVLPDFPAENTACDDHGSRNDHRRLAAWMTAWLNARPELWDGARAAGEAHGK